MRAVCVALLLAGCAPAGLTLEVTSSDPSIRRIELFVGSACDGTCPSAVAPPGLALKQADAYLVVDPQPWSATVTDGVAGFVLKADADQHVPIIIAIGFDAEQGGKPLAVATLHDVHVPASEPAHWRVPLAPASVLDDAPPMAGAERVALWRQPQAPGLACVMVEHGSAARDVIVPSGDTDCDLLPVGECAPWTNLAMDAPGTLASASCLLVGPNPPVCMLGGPTCTEVGGGATRPCAPLDRPYCAPSAFCTACAPWSVDCINDQIATLSSPGIPSITCELPVSVDGTPCNAQSDVSVPIAAAAFVANSNSRCAGVTLNDLATPLGAFDNAVAIDAGKLELKDLTQPCGFSLRFSGKITQGSRNAPFLVDLALSNGKHLMIPLRVKLLVGDSCALQPHCGVTATGDPMFVCTDPVGTPSACAGQFPCGGPMCGTQCCTTGEMCVGGQCRCGTGPGCSAGEECARGQVSLGCGAMCCDGVNVLCTF